MHFGSDITKHNCGEENITEDKQDEIRVRKHFSVRELDCELSHFSFGKVVGARIADSCQGSHKFTTLYCLYTMYVLSMSCMCEFCLLILLITRIPSLSSTFLGERTRISSC